MSDLHARRLLVNCAPSFKRHTPTSSQLISPAALRLPDFLSSVQVMGSSAVFDESCVIQPKGVDSTADSVVQAVKAESGITVR